jgi:hypothetical protein
LHQPPRKHWFLYPHAVVIVLPYARNAIHRNSKILHHSETCLRKLLRLVVSYQLICKKPETRNSRILWSIVATSSNERLNAHTSVRFHFPQQYFPYFNKKTRLHIV